MTDMASFSEMGQQDSAQDIYQQQMDTVSRALLARDLETVLRHMGFPNVMEVEEGEVTINSEDEMRACLEAQISSMRRMRITEYHRICLEAEFRDPLGTEIEGRHVSHFLSGGGHAMPPYQSRMTLRLSSEGVWQSTSLRSALRNRDLTVLCPYVAATGRSA